LKYHYNVCIFNVVQGSRCSSRKPSDSTQRSVEIQPPQRKKHAAPRKPSTGNNTFGKIWKTNIILTNIIFNTGALVSAGFEVSATVVKTKELDEAYVCREDDKPDFNTGRTTAARYLNLQKY
jgi:hypothetical protein